MPFDAAFIRMGRRFAHIAVAVLLGGACAPAAAETELVDRIVAIVNDDVISLYDLEADMRPYREQIEAMGYDENREMRMILKLREDLLNQLIDEKLTDQEVKKYKITVSDAEIDAFLETIKKNSFGSDENFQAALARDGLTLEDYRARVRERMLRTQLLNREVKSKVVITEDDVRAYYEAHRGQYGGEMRYHLKHILMRAPEGTDPARREAVRAEMRSILDRVKAGESFESLADRYSDPTLTLKGGELGTFALSSLSPRIQEAVRGLSQGEVTPLVEGEQGIQIFLVDRVESTEGRSLGEVSAEIENKLAEEIIDRHFSQWLGNLRARSHIKVIL